ncbi:hypothetical protein [Flagellimonas nanhaiensis]|uniref:hypothetical protein n=1 Tax=Flagellimonas nanhaiensis TaxID=2292706 RepID=UPI0015F282B1|nr:hypothetical protein [Allomuricauda nanhaiensis]
MKKLTFILIIGICSCKSGLNSSSRMESDSSPKKCIEIAERKVLEKAVELFETKIEKQYPKVSLESAYFEFIDDWSNKKLSKNFFKDSLELKVRNLNLWTESTRSDKNMEFEKQLFNVDSMNPIRVKLNSDFSTCLANKIDWGIGTSTFLRMNSKYRISPRIAKKKLYRTSQNDMKKFENRLTIVLGVYYQTMFNIKKTVINYGYK